MSAQDCSLYGNLTLKEGVEKKDIENNKVKQKTSSSLNEHQIAFEITQEDIESVLTHHQNNLYNPKGLSLEALATEIFEHIDLDRVSNIALDSGDNLYDQTNGAHDAIELILTEYGVIDLKLSKNKKLQASKNTSPGIS